MRPNVDKIANFQNKAINTKYSIHLLFRKPQFYLQKVTQPAQYCQERQQAVQLQPLQVQQINKI